MFSIRRIVPFALILLVVGPAWAQGDTRVRPERIFLAMQGFTASNLSGAGLSSAFGVRIADVGGVNPTALAMFDRPSVGLSYQFETAIDEGYIAHIGYAPVADARPRSAAVAVPLGAWTLGLSYTQRYAAELDLGVDLPAIITESGEEPGFAYDLVWRSRMETVAPQIAYQTSIATGGTIVLGARVGFGFARFASDADIVSGEIDGPIGVDYESFRGQGTHVAAGASYRTDRYGLAGHYESELRVM